jgi:hypothetical protein
MPNYRFVIVDDDGRHPPEERGLFNDEGALQYARRLSGSRPVEIWSDARLVGRVDPKPLFEASQPLPVAAEA